MYPTFCVVQLQKTKINPKAYECLNQGIASAKSFQFDNANEYFSQAIGTNPIYINPYLNRSRLFAIQKKYESAISDLAAAITIAPNRASLFAKMGSLYFKMKDFKKALNNYNEALNKNSRFYKAYLGKASVYFELGDFKNAILNLKLALKINPSSFKAKTQQYRILSAQKRVPQHYQLGLESLSNRDYQAAIMYFSAALKIVPHMAILFSYRSIAYAQINDYKSALQDISLAINLTEALQIEKQPKLYELLNRRGNIYVQENQSELAIKDFNKAIEINNTFAGAYNNRGVLYYLRKDEGRACADFAKACDLGMCAYYKKTLENNVCE